MMKIYVWFVYFDAKTFLTVIGLQLETMFNSITDLGGGGGVKAQEGTATTNGPANHNQTDEQASTCHV